MGLLERDVLKRTATALEALTVLRRLEVNAQAGQRELAACVARLRAGATSPTAPTENVRVHSANTETLTLEMRPRK